MYYPKYSPVQELKPEDHRSCIAHLKSCFIFSDIGQKSKNDFDF